MSLSVYKSSAGSGKTYTLVKEYIKIAIKGKRPLGIKPILAMTFTNKAAAEMQTRIIEQLNEISDDGLRVHSNMLDSLIEETNFTESEIASRCKYLLYQILHDYSFFAISTIDKFSHKIIRTFASDLGLTQNFEVELNQEDLLEEAIERLISKAGLDKGLTDFLIEFALDRIDTDKSWRIEQELLDTCRVIFQEDSDINLQALSDLSIAELTRIRKEITKDTLNFEKEIKQLGLRGLQIIDNAGIEYSSFQYGNAGGVPSHFGKIKKGNFDLPVANRTIDAIEKDIWYSKSKPQGIKNAIDAIKNDLIEAFYAIEKKKEEGLSAYIIRKKVLENFYATALINEVYKEFEVLKIEKNVLPISDFNKLIGKIVSEQEAPFIYERTGNHFSHFLIDEFQDTSRLQWQNLMPLVENSLATGGENLIVGDGKQAIYRWRGGEVEQFVNIPYLRGSEDSKLLQDRIHYIKAFIKENNLGTNYRSLKNIIEFNNALFTNIALGQDDFTKKIFAEITQKFLPENRGGYVEIQVYNDHKDTEQTFDEFNIERTITCIKGLLEQGYNFGDIAILGRSNSSLIKLVDAFKESSENIPIISSEAMLLEKSEKVRLLNTYLKLIISPEDHHEQLRLLFLLDKVHQFEENLFQMAYSIIKSKTFENFELILASLGFEIDFLSRGEKDAFEILEQALVDLKMTQEADAYLFGFMNEATQFYKKKGTSLSRFLEYFEERKEKLSLSIPGGIDAVQLLTIHKSKGLEFPVVIYPFADYDAKYYGRMWIDIEDEVKGLNRFLIKKNNDLELTRFADAWNEDKRQSDLDEINVLYVACTRAIEQLYVFTSNSNRKMLNKLILPATQKMEGWKDEFNFSFGEKQKIQSSKGDKPKKPSTKIFDLKPLSLKNMHSYPEGDRFEYIFPQTNDAEFDEMSASDYGELVHETFAKILTWKEGIDAIESVKVKKNLSEKNYKLLKTDINRVFNNPEILPYFETDKARMEVEFWDENGKIVRMDRVVEFDDKFVVIDFKTGEQDDEHDVQIRKYKKILNSVYDKEVEGYLIYTESGKLIEVV